MMNRQILHALLFFAAANATLVTSADAQPRRPGKPRVKAAAQGVADYRSRNFLIHTDLAQKDARKLLTRLERMLKLMSRYWGRRNPRVIECFVVEDLNNWSPAWRGRIPPNGLARIRTGGGTTITTTVRRGRLRTGFAKVYSAAARDSTLHEAVHAYCGQAFGKTGPVWYSEGMAEIGQYWRENDSSVNCEDYVVRYLRNAKPLPLEKIVDLKQRTGDSWQNYAWRWALCHVLANNPNYAPRFRTLGLGLLTGKRASFARVYGAMSRDIDFEYRFFLRHLERGYRVDLCSWNWKAKYKQPVGAASVSAKIDARKGWQPSRLRVKSGVTYQFSASGTWKIRKDGQPLDANGDKSGAGKLVGILFRDYQLSKPFELGAYGKFTAPGDGQLLLRCADKWNAIADNKGKVTVQLKVDGKGNPLPKPVPAPPKKGSSSRTASGQ